MFSKQPKGATEQPKKSTGLGSFFWMLVGAILATMVGVFAYLSPWFNFAQTPEPTTTPKDYQVQPKVNTDKDNTDYEFYDVLPNQEMVTIPDASLEEDNKDGSLDEEVKAFKPDVVVVQQRRIEEAVKQEQDKSEDNADNYGISEETILNPEEPNTDDGNTSDAMNDNASVSSNEATGQEQSKVITNADVAQNNARQGQQGTASIQKATPSKTYILQINSFSSADEADQRRAQVLMAGVDARVVKTVTANNQQIYQVVSRPMSNRQAVIAAQQRLQNNGIDSIIVEQRRK